MKLSRIAFYGRTLDEYEAIYGLKIANLRDLNLLDVSAGSSSFGVEAGACGVNVVAVDPLYSNPFENIRSICEEDLHVIIDQLPDLAAKFEWDYYGDVAGRERMARKSSALFLEDYLINRSRYVCGALPSLPFPDNSFDLILCGHFLLTYAEKLGEKFVVKAIEELLRVSRREVLIYPLLTSEGVEPVWLNDFIDSFTGMPCLASTVDTKFMFQKGANRYLRLTVRNDIISR